MNIDQLLKQNQKLHSEKAKLQQSFCRQQQFINDLSNLLGIRQTNQSDDETKRKMQNQVRRLSEMAKKVDLDRDIGAERLTRELVGLKLAVQKNYTRLMMENMGRQQEQSDRIIEALKYQQPKQQRAELKEQEKKVNLKQIHLPGEFIYNPVVAEPKRVENPIKEPQNQENQQKSKVLQRRLEAFENELNEKKSALEVTMKRYEAQRNEYLSASTKLSDLNVYTNMMNKKNEDLLAAVSQLEVQKSKLQAELLVSHQKLKKTQQLENQLVEEHRKLTEVMSQLQQSRMLTSQKQRILLDMQSSRSNSENELQQRLTKLSETNKILQDQTKQLRDAIAKREKQMDDNNKLIEQLNKQIEVGKSQIRQLKKICEQLQHKVVNQEEAISYFQKTRDEERTSDNIVRIQLDGMHRKYAELLTEKDRTDNKMLEDTLLIGTLKANLQTLRQVEQSRQIEISHLKEQVKILEEKEKQLQELCRQKDEEQRREREEEHKRQTSIAFEQELSKEAVRIPQQVEEHPPTPQRKPIPFFDTSAPSNQEIRQSTSPINQPILLRLESDVTLEMSNEKPVKQWGQRSSPQQLRIESPQQRPEQMVCQSPTKLLLVQGTKEAERQIELLLQGEEYEQKKEKGEETHTEEIDQIETRIQNDEVHYQETVPNLNQQADKQQQLQKNTQEVIQTGIPQQPQQAPSEYQPEEKKMESVPQPELQIVEHTASQPKTETLTQPQVLESKQTDKTIQNPVDHQQTIVSQSIQQQTEEHQAIEKKIEHTKTVPFYEQAEKPKTVVMPVADIDLTDILEEPVNVNFSQKTIKVADKKGGKKPKSKKALDFKIIDE